MVPGSESSLQRRVADCLPPLQQDLMWVMSRSGQELFHSNVLGFLMEGYPDALLPVRRLFEGDKATGPVETWRELRNLDLVGRSATARYVVENKLYSLPCATQLVRYLGKPLPWDAAPGPNGATGTSYVLLSLMAPAFELPIPWTRRSYEDLSLALQEVSPADVGEDKELFLRYRTMVGRMVDLRAAIDPSLHATEPFSVTQLLSDPTLRTFSGPLQRMRYSGLIELIRDHYQAPHDFKVDLSNTRGLAEYLHRHGSDRYVGWQLQGDDLRLVVLFRESGLAGKGQAMKDKRAALAEEHWLDYFDFSKLPTEVVKVLTPNGGTKPNAWNHYDPDFVYRYRRVAPATSTNQLARALAQLTERAAGWRPPA